MGKCAAESLPTTKRSVGADGSGGLTVQDKAAVLVNARIQPHKGAGYLRSTIAGSDPADTRVDRRHEHQVSQVHGRDAVSMSSYI